MRRATLIFILFSFFPLALLPGDATGGSACSNALFPPFISNGVKPNILIILDNSQSMDEDFFGNAVGSYSSASKSVAARQALQNVVSSLQGKANVGVMSFSLPSDVSNNWYVHNGMPFASYNPNSYCPNATPATIQACVNYCTNMDSADKAACDAGCPANASLGQTFTSFTGQLFTHNDGTQTNFTDLIITSYAPGNPIRARYCGLTYPKTQMWEYNDPLGFTTTVYYNQTDPFYDTSNDGTLFGYSGKDSPTGQAYSTAENAANTYTYCPDKKGTSDSFVGYSGPSGGSSTNGCANYQFIPTDSDWALGFYNWGQSMPWYYVGPTWFSNSQGSGSPQGYLQVPLGDISNLTQYDSVYNILNPNLNNSAGYMGCTAGNKNACPYIINASNTPTAGTLQAALNYFSGTLKQGATSYATPITASCQKNYIILVTDGMPSTMLDGTQPLATTQYCYNSSGVNNNTTCTTTSTCSAPYNAFCTTPVMGQVINQLYDLQTQVTIPFSGNTYYCLNSSGAASSQTCTKNSDCKTAPYNVMCSDTFPINTYVLGIGSEANGNLNSMAVEGATATSSGQAYYAGNATQLTDALNSILANLFAGVSSGSSISILSEGQSQNGDNMVQGVFYPSKPFGTTNLAWPGYLYDYWFYNSPTTSNIREDTVHDFIFELNADDELSFDFNTQSGLSITRLQDPSGSGTGTVQIGSPGGLDTVTPIWEAGKLLFQTTAASRQILTPGNSATGLVSFNTSNTTLTTAASSPLGNPSTFDPCLSQPPGASATGILDNLINYVNGTDLTSSYCYNGTSFNSTTCHSNSDCTSGSYTTCATISCRNRTVGLCSNGTAFNNTPCNSNGDCVSPYSTCTKNVWKLGDIVYSTPQVQADYKYCSNGTSFNTQVCSTGSDCTTPGYTSCQTKQSVIFVGANDGMLHAFQTGTLTVSGLNTQLDQIEALTGIPTASMGQELWGFIPTNTLPYLRCLAVPPPGGCHLYYNDLSPYITTMNIDTVNGPVKHTVLIGGMRLGGATISTVNYCLNSSGQYASPTPTTCTQVSNCTAPYNAKCSNPYYYIDAPSDTCSALSSATSFTSASALCANPATCYNPSNCTGLSEYYAIDITDAQNPVLLWEFSHPFLGYTYSGPAVIRKWTNPSTLLGDQYYVMFLSGPTSGTDGSSIQDVQTFVLTLDPTNLKIKSVYYKDLGATTKNGFGGRLFTTGLDVNADGYTDFVFFGYANSANGTSTDWTGGIAKINTNNTNPNLATNPADWTYDITTYANIATLPITSKVATMQCFNNTWYLYAGTGRYFSSQDSYGFTPSGGSTPTPNYLMGIPFTCDQFNNNCTSITSLSSQNAIATACAGSNGQTIANTLGQGWIDTLDAAAVDGSYLAERLVTDPTINPGTVQNPANQVFFTTSEPTSDACGYGGQSRVWGLNCATGGPITGSCGTDTITGQGINGFLYLQTSTGAIYRITDAGSFGFEGGRATKWYTGMPPESSPSFVQPTISIPQQGRVIQWIEK
jgi:hypothetical protein